MIRRSLFVFALSLVPPDPRGFGTHELLGMEPCGWADSGGIPCPTCGVTTAACHLVHLSPIKAVATHPFGAALAGFGIWLAGIAGMTRCMALEGQKYGIRCFILAPVALSRLTEDLPGFQDEGFKAKMDPKLITPLVTFLASDLAKDMTNKTFFVGGGRIAEMKMVTAAGVTKTEGGGLWTPQEIAAQMSGILLPE